MTKELVGAEQETIESAAEPSIEESTQPSAEEATTQSAASSGELPFTKEQPIIVNRIQKNDKGGIDYMLSLTADQTYILLNFAVMFLMSQGLLMFANVEVGPEQTEETITLGKQIH